MYSSMPMSSVSVTDLNSWYPLLPPSLASSPPSSGGLASCSTIAPSSPSTPSFSGSALPCSSSPATSPISGVPSTSKARSIHSGLAHLATVAAFEYRMNLGAVVTLVLSSKLLSARRAMPAASSPDASTLISNFSAPSFSGGSQPPSPLSRYTSS